MVLAGTEGPFTGDKGHRKVPVKKKLERKDLGSNAAKVREILNDDRGHV